MGDDVVYSLYWVFVILAMALSWRRSRSLLHAHFLFTTMLCVHVSDFLVRGYNDNNPAIEFIPRDSLYQYQIMILAAFTMIVVITANIRDRGCEQYVYNAARDVTAPTTVLARALFLAWTLLAAEVIKRLISVDWSIDEVINQSLASRFDRIWVANAYFGNFIFSLITIFLPLSSVAFAFILVNSKGPLAHSAIAGFLFSLVILVTDGTRTPVALAFGALWIFSVLRIRNFFGRAIISIAIMGAAAATFSVMIESRSFGYFGYGNTHADVTGSFELAYHQDDSYYWALYASDYSDRSGKFWDPIRFAYITAVNPIPRFFWPDKPVLDEAFLDGFKLYHAAILYYGELVAMFGVELGMLMAVLLGVLLYLILFRAQRLLRFPMGLVSYICVALYAYMVLRSLSSVTHFVYLPLFAVAATAYWARRGASVARRLA